MKLWFGLVLSGVLLAHGFAVADPRRGPGLMPGLGLHHGHRLHGGRLADRLHGRDVWPGRVHVIRPYWAEGHLAWIRPRTICVDPLPGYVYGPRWTAPTDPLMPPEYRCIETK